MSEIDRLDVYLHGGLAGVLERLSQARLRFTYDENWIGAGEAPLSLSLPVRAESFDHDECAPFFEGLLPEGEFLKAIARTLHVSASNPFQLLTELGGECAGAISVAPVGAPEPGRDPRPPRWLDEEELSTLLADLPQRPLVAAIDEVEDGGGFRLSIAGAQDKVGVLIEGSRIGLSHGDPPTNGILKAPIPHVEESVVNEAYCMSLAAHVDLDVAAAVPGAADSHDYLLVRRYDRGRDTRDGRIHQEDFCQALGLVPAVKYEKEGGPTVADCAGLIRRHCAAPVRDLMAFLDALLFNFAIANHDAHSKNYSLLLDGPGAIRLAPLYDLISTAVFARSDRKLAMRYGGENRPQYLRGRHLDRLAHALGVKPALVRRRAMAMRERVEAAIEDARRALPEEFQDRPMIDKVTAVVAERGEALTKRAREAGDPVVQVSSETVGDSLAEIDQAGDAISQGFDRLKTNMQQAARIIQEGRVDLEDLKEQGSPADIVARAEQLARELEEPSNALKKNGRDIYDAVVEFGSVLDRLLDRLEVQDDLTSDNIAFLGTWIELAATADTQLTFLQDYYSAISELESLHDFRAPVRNLRAGLRDVLDARGIIFEWGDRARALQPEDH